MRIVLSDGGEAHLLVKYGEYPVQVWRDGERKEEQHRATFMLVTMPNGITYETMAVCHPPDVFTRKAGRSITTRRMAKKLSTYDVSQEDRRRILSPMWQTKKPEKGNGPSKSD